MKSLDSRRVLEVGTGFGRLTPQILRNRGEYVGVDFDPGGLRETRASTLRNGLENPHATWLAANAYHLPFASRSFSSICMVRVHHHLANPVQALNEIARVLAPGGTALITYSPRSRFRSLSHDLRVLFRRPKVANDRYVLFSRGGHVLIRERPPQQYITDPVRFDRDLEEAGLLPVHSYGGAETTVARMLPLDFGVRGGQWWPGAPFYSTRWVVVRKEGPRTELPPWEKILACPRCGAPGPPLVGATVLGGPCHACGFIFRWAEDVVDARYVRKSTAPEVTFAPDSPARPPFAGADRTSPVGVDRPAESYTASA